MKMGNKYFAISSVSLALAGGWSCLELSGRGAEQSPVNPAERVRVLQAEDPGLLPMDQVRSFSSSIFTETSKAGVSVLSFSRVNSRTNQQFTALRQNMVVQATEPQLLDFLESVAAGNSPLRIQSLSVRPTPDGSRLQASIAIGGDYRLPGDSATAEYLVLSQRRHLRRAVLDCYSLTKSTLPSGWQLDSLSVEDGKRLSAHGQAPADQVSLLEEVRARLEKAQGQDGKELFVPYSGEASMRMVTPGLTNFTWSMQLDLRPAESR